MQNDYIINALYGIFAILISFESRDLLTSCMSGILFNLRRDLNFDSCMHRQTWKHKSGQLWACKDSKNNFYKRSFLFQRQLEKGLILLNQFLDELTLSDSFGNSTRISNIFPLPWLPIMFGEGFQWGPTERPNVQRQRKLNHKQKSSEQMNSRVIRGEMVMRCGKRCGVINGAEMEAVVGDGVNWLPFTSGHHPFLHPSDDQ